MTRNLSIKNILLYVLVVSVISACSLLSVEPDDNTKDNTAEVQTYLRDNNLNYTQTNSGMYYDVTKTNLNGKSVTIGEEVRTYFQITLLNGTVIDSILTGDPLSFGYFEGQIFAGFTEAVSILREGEKGIFIIPSALAYRNQPVPGVPAGSVVRLELEILSFRDEEQQIEAYITDNNLENVTVTPTRLRFIPIDTTAIAAPLTNGDLVKVRYKGTFLNGRTFDEGDFDFTLGRNEAVLGFEQGVKRMSVGHKAIVIFPSSLGYGENGQGPIPPFSPLLFELEVVSKR